MKIAKMLCTLFCRFALVLLCAQPLWSQQSGYAIQGRVLDGVNNQPLSGATIKAPKSKLETRSDSSGLFYLLSKSPIREITVTMVGYEAQTIEIPVDTTFYRMVVALQPRSETLKEVTIKPTRYRNKNNPAVDLIELVIKNRPHNRIEAYSTFQEEQYEKMMLGISQLSEKNQNRKILRSWKFVMDNVDTSKLNGQGVIPAYLSESIQNFYSQKDPKRQKTWIKAQQKVQFPLLDDAGIEKYLRYLYQDINIYDNYVVLLTDHFLSPIANNAPLFYRYYPADTLVENGAKIVRLQFFPRNKTDMLLQGDLFIALDSTYPVTRIQFTVNPQVNLNWVRLLEVEQHFGKIPGANKWALTEEQLYLDFAATKNGPGIFGERLIVHQHPVYGAPIPDSIFQQRYEARTLLQNAAQKDTSFWNAQRPTPLSSKEANTYRNMDSLQQTRLFKQLYRIGYTLAIGNWRVTPGLDIGRLYSFYVYNPVEGHRIRIGGRTNTDWSKRLNLEGYAAYGFGDRQWKYGVGATYSLQKDQSYNQFPYHLIRVNYQQDITPPGAVSLGNFAASGFSNAFVAGANDRFFFQKRFMLQYEREFHNQFSFQLGFEYRSLAPRGSMSFNPTNELMPAPATVASARPFVQIRYAPGEEYYQTKIGMRQRIRFNTIASLRYARGVKALGGQYTFDELTLVYYKYSRIPPIGYNYLYIEAGGVLGRVPYPLLAVHRANPTYGYRFLSYNLMNYLEFVSDRYLAIHMEHSFYGFFTNKIPAIRKLKLREFATAKILYGGVHPSNQPVTGGGLLYFPTNEDDTPLTYALDARPYIEATVGIGNIFKVLRIDLVRRFTYLEHPGARSMGLRFLVQMQF